MECEIKSNPRSDERCGGECELVGEGMGPKPECQHELYRKEERMSSVLSDNENERKSVVYNELGKIAGGFYVCGFYGNRMTCNVKSLFREACLASNAVITKTDYCLSMWEYPDAFLQVIGETGRAKDYKGVLWGPFFWLDIDDKVDLRVAFADTVKCVEYLTCTFGLSTDNLQIWFSGFKGFHVGLPIEIFGKMTMPSETFHSVCKAVAQRMAKEAGIVIDTSVYTNVQTFRCPNTKNSKSDLYKIPVRLSELKSEDAMEIITQRAKNPRRLIGMDGVYDDMNEDDVTYVHYTTCVEEAEQMWNDAVSALSVRTSHHTQAATTGHYMRKPQGLRRDTQAFISGGVKEGGRAVATFKAAADCYRNGVPEEQIRSNLLSIAQSTGLSPQEATKQIECGINAGKQNGVYVASSTPQELAEAYVKLLPGLTRVYSGGAWFDWRQQCGWYEVSESVVKAETTNFIRQTINQQQAFEPQKTQVNRWLIQSVMDNVQAMLTVITPNQDTIDPTVWLRFDDDCITAEPAEGWIATRSHLLHVPRVAEALYRGTSIPEGAIRPVNSSLFSTGMIPCDFDVNARCPRWKQFVDESCPQDAAMLQMLFGLSLTYDRHYNIFGVVHGEAGTGKSTALNILARLGKGTTCGVSLSQLGERFQEYPLTVNRVNIVQDMESIFEGSGSASKREAALKSCTAGEKIQVDRKHKPVEYRYLCALSIFGCNALPRFSDRSQAISDRMRIISFPNVFRGLQTQDLLLGEKLNAELSGILIWALRGYGALLDSGSPVFPETRQSQALKASAIKATRPEELFCDEMLEKVDLENELSTKEVYLAYKDYCNDFGYKAAGSSKVIPEIAKYMGVEKEKRSAPSGRMMCFIGLNIVGRTPRVSGCNRRSDT